MRSPRDRRSKAVHTDRCHHNSNSRHIESRQFLKDASEILLERMRDIMQRHNSIKINTVFYSEFITGDKCANKSIITRNCELFNMSDLQE